MAAASAALRLSSCEAVRAFLLGRWALAKTLDYRIGGGRGSMVGTATFEETPQRQGVLLYEERGMVELEGVARPFEAYRNYVFNTCKWPVEVYFVNDPTKKHLPTLVPELECHTSFFLPLPFADEIGVAAESSHLCIDDLYSGEITVTGPDAFDWCWSIKGPKKDGDIMCSYT